MEQVSVLTHKHLRTMPNKINKRGRYSASFKKEVVREALREQKTISQIASDYGISPDCVKDWKRQALAMMDDGFKRGGRKSELERKDAEIAKLQQLLGKSQFELDWLSKKAKELGL